MLNSYKTMVSTIRRESDFYEFWDAKLNELKNKPLKLEMTTTETLNTTVRKSFIYNSIDDKMISGNLFIPQNYNDKLPVIVVYHGLGANTFGNDYFSLMESTWLSKGFLVVGFDVRGQNGKSEYDLEEPFHEYGLYCRNILDKNNYYYVKTYLDGVRLLDVVETLEETKGKDIVCNGGSQGGAITLSVCSLDKRPKLAFADIPSNSNLCYMISQCSGGFANIKTLLDAKPELTEQIMNTVSYVDTCNLVNNINIPVLCSVGGLDKVCPPEGFYQAFRQIRSEKHLEIYPEYAHGGYDHLNFPNKVKFIEEKFNLKVE